MRAAVAATVFAAAGSAQACGYCVEDKIAAVYDHGVVTRAFVRRHHVVFLHVDGAAPSRTALERAAYAAPGVDAGSVRVSDDLLTVSFSYDPARATLGLVHGRMEKALKGVSLTPFEVIERPGQLKAVKAAR